MMRWLVRLLVRGSQRLRGWLLRAETCSMTLIGGETDQTRLRLAICARCPLFTKRGFCDAAKGGCGCNMKLKARFATATCPQKRW